MARFTQEYRHVKITSPLGTDKLLITGMQGNEGISRLFNFELSLVSEDKGILFADIIGKGVTVSIELPSGDWRYFNGIISTFSQVSGNTASGDDTTRAALYRATLVPKLWLLTRSAELRIFQNMTVPEIVEKVFKKFEITDYELKLQGNFEKREYCVQYRETHFNFISRLLEEEGIFYFFEHNADNHKLIIANSSQANVPCPGQSTASYLIEGITPDDDTISSLENIQMILPGKYMLSDFNFETPNNSLNVNIPGKYKLGPGDREIYDYPGGYTTMAPGNALVKVRMEEKEAQITTVRGGGKCRSFTSGYRFTLINADRSEMNNKEYILTSVAHTISQSAQAGGDFDYGNSFCSIPADVPYRPPRVTPKPVVQGTQTAIVVGPPGEELWPDKYGRVKVQFHWDREGDNNEHSSCWIRVSQLWAGTGWGAMYIPRIGQEVIVDFLEGDPDCPIITGRVYHATNMPPYNLPAEKTKSTIKSNSSPDGGGFNELRFEDKKGNEEIFLHGQKDWTIQILNNKNQTIGNDETLDVGHDRTKDVKNNQSESIGVNKTIIVGKNHTESIGENASIDIGKNETISVGENVSIVIGKNFTEEIAEKSDTTVGKDKSIQVGKNSSTSVGENMVIDVGKKLNITAAEQITLTTGSSSITMKKDGTITIKGKDITLNGSGKINAKAGGNVTIKGSKVLSN